MNLSLSRSPPVLDKVNFAGKINIKKEENSSLELNIFQ
jgi:hypothetical protein